MERLIDMEDRHLCLLRKLLSDHLENKTVWAYGSRAKWNAKQSSDLDLVVWDASTTQITEAIDAFSESNLPFTVQLFAWEKTPKDFQEDIRKKYVVLQEGSKIPEGWREAKLGDVAVFNYGKSLLEQKRLSGDIPVFSSAGLIGWHNEPLVKERGIVIGRKGTIGSVHKSDIPFFPIDTSFYISESDTECNLNFLYYLLREIRLDKLNSDSAVPGLNRNTAYAQDIKIPPLPEQKAIAEVLSSLEDKIDLLHRQNKTLENIAQTLFRKWFIEDAGEEWEERKLGDFFPIVTGKKDANYSTEDGKYPFFTCAQDIIKAPEYSFEGDAILLAGNGDFNVKRYTGKFEAYQRTYVLIPYESKYSGFLYTLIKFHLLAITGGAQGSVVQFITKGMISNFKFLMPKDNFNHKLKQFNELYVRIDLNSNQIRKLETMRDTFLPNLISGKVRVGGF